MIAGKAFAGTGFPGFICKACGCVLSDYQNDTLGFTPPFAGKLKMGCGLFRRAMPRCIYNPSKRGLLRKRRSKRARRRRLFCDRCNLPKAKKTSEQSGLCSDVARVFPVRHARSAPSPAPRGAAAAKGRKARRRRRARVYKRAAAASGAFCGKGGVRERGDGGFFAADAICQKQKRRRSKADFAPTWRAFFRCGTHAPPHPPRREARQPQKAGKRGAGVARAFTSAQPQLAGPFAEKEE